MNKNLLIITAIGLGLINLFIWYQNTEQLPKQAELNSSTLNVKPKTGSRLDKLNDRTKSLVTSTLKHAFKQLGYSLVFPFSMNDKSYTSSLATAKIIANNAIVRKTVTFNNLTNQLPESTTSMFNCPPQLPYATAYTLESPTQNIIIYGEIYRNVCNDAIKYDLLYNSNQVISMSGNAANLSAFIPSSLPNSCKSHNLLDIKINESSLIVSPISEIVNNESMITGFKQSTNIEVDCNKLCNHMINNLCAVNWDYCNETIIASYYKKGIYKETNTPEYFCSCSIEWQYGTEKGSFTNAIDIESLVNYSNSLNSVTCSNFPDSR